jgi:hypothetical protein
MERLSAIRKKEKDYTEFTESTEFAEKRDGNTPTGSGQAPVTEVGTQRAQREDKSGGGLHELWKASPLKG